jgi:SynChlorMet cassette radical SAM/SPASM protein ScmF
MKDQNIENSRENFPLTQLYFYLTEGCNLACRHCWLAPKLDPEGNKYSSIPFSLFTKAIKEAIPLGLTGVKLTGGEPLLHPDIMEILDFLYGNQLELTIETNGVLMTPEIARTIARHHNPVVSVSLDGADAETHDTIRGIKGCFNKTVTGIKNLSAEGIHPQVIMSIMQSNADQLDDVIELAETLGASSVKFNIIQPTGRGEKILNSNDGLAVKDIIRLGRKVDSVIAAGPGLNLYFDYPAAFHSLRSFASNNGCGTCGIFSILGALPSGEYALCGIGSHVKELVFGKIGNDSLAEIWENNETLNTIRHGLPDKLTGVCSRCLMKYQCLGSCIAQSYYRINSLWAPFWFCEQALAEGYFPESRLDIPLKS